MSYYDGMTKHERKVAIAVETVCHECSNRGLDYDGIDAVCCSCNMSRIYEAILENVHGRREGLE